MAAKLFITDEVNDSQTAQVTRRGQVKVGDFAQTHLAIATAASSATIVANDGACWLKSVVIGSLPATATTLLILDTATSAASALTYDVSGANKITKIRIPAVASSVAVSGSPSIEARNIDLNIYCTTGLTYALGGCGTDTGNAANITIIYEDL